MRLVASAVVLAIAIVPSRAESPVFRDDPLLIEPETQDASGATTRDISLEWDILYNLFASGQRPEPTRALDVNTVDEVPDSSWFTNRVGTVPPGVAGEELRSELSDPQWRRSTPAQRLVAVIALKELVQSSSRRLVDQVENPRGRYVMSASLTRPYLE